MKVQHLWFTALTLLTACGNSTYSNQRSEKDKDVETGDRDEIALTLADEMIPAAVESYYVTLSIGRDGPAGPCRKSNFKIVSDAPLKLKKSYWDESKDSITQTDDYSIHVASQTLNGRDGLVFLVQRGASLKVQDEVAGQGFTGCSEKSAAISESIDLDLSTFNTDLYAPKREGKFGRNWPFARLVKFLGGRYSIRSTFRIASDNSDTLGIAD